MSGFEGELGYRSLAYAGALAEAGRPVPFGQTGGFLLERPIAGTSLVDLTGPYPLFCCADWGMLASAIEELDARHASVTLVADPFCPLPPARLAELFPVLRSLHDHFIIDLTRPSEPSRHHRRKLRGSPDASLVAGPPSPAMADDWVRLYEGLVARKGIRDLRRFGSQSLRRQLEVPGAHLVAAYAGADLVGADLYYLDGDVAYAHLSAYAPAGYAASVSYPMMACAISYFRDRARFIDLGGVPAADSEGSGLRHFKGGWTSLTRPSHLCGKVLDPAAYATLAAARGAERPYFPAYRQGEFG